MARLGPVLLLVSLALSPAHAHAQVRFAGLERLYFTRVAEGDQALPSSLPVAALLPEALPQPGPPATDGSTSDDGPRTHDVELPALPGKRTLLLREITGNSLFRIHKLWWALYVDGKRCDVWTYTADPQLTDHKMLYNYEIVSVSAPGPDALLFRVRGEMFRPLGAWSIVGREWRFAVKGSAITLSRVRDAFGFFRGYDRGHDGPDVAASTEAEVDGHLERRSVHPVSAESLRACGFVDPLLDENWEFSWDPLQSAARCITGREDALVTIRSLDSASFGERAR